MIPLKVVRHRSVHVSTNLLCFHCCQKLGKLLKMKFAVTSFGWNFSQFFSRMDGKDDVFEWQLVIAKWHCLLLASSTAVARPARRTARRAARPGWWLVRAATLCVVLCHPCSSSGEPPLTAHVKITIIKRCSGFQCRLVSPQPCHLT